jgi:hypothetical protein
LVPRHLPSADFSVGIRAMKVLEQAGNPKAKFRATSNGDPRILADE